MKRRQKKRTKEIKGSSPDFKKRNILLYSFGLLPILAYFFYFFKYNVNIPFEDDYFTILGFIGRYMDASGIPQRIALMFSQHNEHRLVFNRLVTLMNYYSMGNINLSLLMLIGNLSLLGLLAVLFKKFSLKKEKLLLFIPVVFLLFQPQYYGATFWAISALENMFILFFASLSLYLVSDKRRSFFYTGLLFAVISVFTAANGLLVLLIGLAILLFQHRRKEAFVWGMVSAVIFVLYFNNFTQLYVRSFYFDKAGITRVFLFFFAFLGSSLTVGYAKLARSLNIYLLWAYSFAMGLCIFGYFIYLVKEKYYKKNIRLFAFMFFLLLSAVLNALGRSGMGMEQAFTSRQIIMSALLLVCIYLSLIERTKKESVNKVYVTALIIAISFNILSFILNTEEISVHKKRMIYAFSSWQYNKTRLELICTNEPRETKILAEAVSKGYFIPEKFDMNEIGSKRADPLLCKENNKVKLNIEYEIKNSDVMLTVYGWGYMEGLDAAESKLFFVLNSPEHTYIYETERLPRPDVAGYFKDAKLLNSGFRVIIHKLSIEPGEYKAGLFIKNGKAEGLTYIKALKKI